MTNDKEEFIKAIENDEAYEWSLNSDVTLFTDVEFDGTFMPSIHVTEGSYSIEEIEKLMEDNNVHEVFDWDIVEYSENNDCYFPIVMECEYESVDNSVWD